jgi:hypothetical protein
MADYLAQLSEAAVAGFYRRLALSIQKKFGGDSLAAILLLHWLDGGGKDKVFPARYVRNLAEVRSYLRDTARPIFLSQSRTPSGSIGGVVPRIKAAVNGRAPGPQGTGGVGTQSFPMHLEGNVTIGLSVELKAKLGMQVDPRELDALYALHGFLVKSEVTASASRGPNPTAFRVTFERWISKTSDEYHWNPDKHIEVPNPDYGSKDKDAVAPTEQNITVYHSNAIRVEKAGLAKPFHDESEPWEENDPTVVGPATVTI